MATISKDRYHLLNSIRIRYGVVQPGSRPVFVKPGSILIRGKNALEWDSKAVLKFLKLRKTKTKSIDFLMF